MFEKSIRIAFIIIPMRPLSVILSGDDRKGVTSKLRNAEVCHPERSVSLSSAKRR